MARPAEILFVDPAVADVETILGNLRPEVHAIVLDARWPAERQIAAALEGHRRLDAVHIIAHGAPGRVNFAAGEWSAANLKEAAHDFATIGRALAADGELRLWSCNTASGDAGEAFIEALSEAVGAEVCASTSLVGAAALGGTWEISARASASMPPLTSDGVASYAGVLAAGGLVITGTIQGAGNSSNVNTYYLVKGTTIVNTFQVASATQRFGHCVCTSYINPGRYFGIHYP